ncbi:dipeptidase [Corynebacterium kroppenstedtii]|uniref:dipeptidase n=1 Tax=Corynebacterium sp. PCR 32 TaxID=3351342 RepID=UPI0030967A53
MTHNDTTNSAETTRSSAPYSPSDAARYISSRMDDVRAWLTELVSYASVHDFAGLEEDNAKAANWVADAFTAAGIPVDKHVTTDGSTAIIGLRQATDGMPTVLLYSHFDVQPATDTDAWDSDPWTLTERNGRWYGRGAADCKGNLVMHLAALHGLKEWEERHPDEPKIGIRIVVEGSEERGGAGLDSLLDDHPELFAADDILIADSGSDRVGEPALCTSLRGSAGVTVALDTLEGPVHSGQFGGAAPDALLAMIQLLGTLHDENGLLTVDGLDTSGQWNGNHTDPETFRKDASVLDGVELYGAAGTTSGEGPSVTDLTVAQPAITVTALDAVPTKEAINAVPAHSAAVLNLRVPSTMNPIEAQDALVAHLENHVPWGAHITIERESIGEPFSADTSGPLHAALRDALTDAFDNDVVFNASGGSIPLCAGLLTANPNAELALFGVEEPECRIHSANESVDPSEIKHFAIAELLFLTRFGRT